MKTIKKVTGELKKNQWSNDTLAPLSIKAYLELCADLVNDDEIAQSAMMATSVSKVFLLQQKNMLVATDKRLVIARQSGEVRHKNLSIDYDKILRLKISQDYYMAAKIYATFKYKKSFFGLFFRVKYANFEVLDPTSAFHFQRYLEQKLQKRAKNPQQNN